MKWDQIKQEFPQMPDTIRLRITHEVEAQLQAGRAGETEPEIGKYDGSYGVVGNERGELPARLDADTRRGNRLRRRWPARRIAAVAAAAVLACGGTVFAATQMYQMNVKQQSEHAVAVDVVPAVDNAADSGAGTKNEAAGESGSLAAAPVSEEVPEVRLVTGEMPSGMEDNSADKGTTSWANPDDQFGYFIGDPILIDVADPLEMDYVREAEKIKVGERDAVYVDQQFTADENWGWKDLYILFPEVERIEAVSAWGHASREELLKIAEQVDLEPTGEMISRDGLFSWSEFVQNQKDRKAEEESYEPEELRQTASDEEMENLHQIGDVVPVKAWLEQDMDEVALQAKVTDVQIADDLSLLTKEDAIPDSWKKLAGDDGTLAPVVVSHIRYGDGVETLDETIRTEDRPVRLAYVTLDYTNNGEEDLQNVWYYGSLVPITHKEGSWQIKTRSCDDCDGISETPAVTSGEMLYSDVNGGERNNNYIPELSAGETVTVHMAFLIDADDADDLYLAINGQNDYQFDDEMLETGLVRCEQN